MAAANPGGAWRDAAGTAITPAADCRNNEAFASGVTYLASEQAGPTDSDAVTFTVEDALGATDTVNFIFNVTGALAVNLEGTTEKDVIFATGHSDTLSGYAGNDTFVFSLGEQNFGADTITDFKTGGAPGAEIDRIMLTNGWVDNFDDLDITEQGGDTVFNLTDEPGGSVVGSITLQNVTGLTPENFIFQPGVIN